MQHLLNHVLFRAGPNALSILPIQQWYVLKLKMRKKKSWLAETLTEGTSVLHFCLELNCKCPRLLLCALAANTFCFLLKYHFVADVYSYAKDFV